MYGVHVPPLHLRLILGVALLTAAFSTPLARASTTVVGDGTPASCTEAALTTALAAGGTVSFNCGAAAAISITTLKVIEQDAVILGGGAITLTAEVKTRLFYVKAPASLALNDIVLENADGQDSDGGAIMATGPLTLNNVTILNSQVGPDACGGAIAFSGRAAISGSRFEHNRAGFAGGAICPAFGGAPTLEVESSTFRDNSATVGGALMVPAAATATVRSSVFLDNSATLKGGAIYSLGIVNAYDTSFFSNGAKGTATSHGYGGGIASLGTLALHGGAFFNNESDYGGGLYAGAAGFPSEARAEISDLSFYQNLASLWGGGLYADGATTAITVTGSSFQRNTAETGGAIARFDAQVHLADAALTYNEASIAGGGLYAGAGAQACCVQLRSVTIASNETDNQRGGAIYNNGSSLELYFSTVVSNTGGLYSDVGGATFFRSSVFDFAGPGACESDGTARFVNEGANHISDDSCGPVFEAAGAAGLGRAESDDGPFTLFFYLPLPGSPLINAGHSTCPAHDQRGAIRRDACDIGAVELGGLLPRLYLPLAVH